MTQKQVEFLTPEKNNHIIVPEYLKECYLDTKHLLLPKNFFYKKLLIFLHIKIIRKIKIILYFFLNNKIVFKLPQHKKLVVFDDENFEVLKKIIDNNNYFLLKTRIEKIDKIYLSKEIIYYLIKNFYKRSLKENYIKILLEKINPKTVITLIDNSVEFFKISKLLSNKIKFIAIQNSQRYEFHANNKDLNIPNYFVFGDYEVDLFKKKNGVGNIKAVGSISAAVAKKKFKEKNQNIHTTKYDICLISEPRLKLNRDFQRIHKEFNVKEKMGLIAEYTIRYCKEYNKKFIFSGKADTASLNFQKQEKLFYQEVIKNKNIQISFNDKKKFEQYKNIQDSSLIIGMSSTMLRDAFEFRKKILICNFIDHNDSRPPSNGICVLNSANYDSFRSRVTEILSLDYESYLSKIEKASSFYNMQIDTLDFLRNEIK